MMQVRCIQASADSIARAMWPPAWLCPGLVWSQVLGNQLDYRMECQILTTAGASTRAQGRHLGSLLVWFGLIFLIFDIL
jgi:hypothetical protein